MCLKTDAFPGKHRCLSRFERMPIRSEREFYPFYLIS